MNTSKSPFNFLCIVALIALPSIGIATVPHNFTSGTPAKAAEVNENFENLDSRVSTLESSVNTVTENSGFSMPFAAVGQEKNVVVMVRDNNLGGKSYKATIRYANSTDQVSVSGVLTIRPFISNNVYVGTVSDGSIVDISSYVDAPDNESFSSYTSEVSNYDPQSLIKTLLSDDKSYTEKCNDKGGVLQCLGQGKSTSDPSFDGFYSYAYIQSLMEGPYTISNITYSQDIQLRHKITGSRGVRINVKGVGTVLEQPSTVSLDNSGIYKAVYYHSNGVTGGSLSGSPFAPGQPLAGLFF